MYNEHRALRQFLLTGRRHTHTHAHTQKNWTPSGLYFGLSARREGELRARAYTCTCPPRAVWSSLSGVGTRTQRHNTAPSTRDEGKSDGRQPARGRTRLEMARRPAIKPEKSFPDRVTPGEADPDCQTERANHSALLGWEGFIFSPLSS